MYKKIVSIFFMLLFVLSSVAFQDVQNAEPVSTIETADSVCGAPFKFDETPRVAVLSAFRPEITLLLENTVDQTQYEVLGRTFTTGTLRGVPVALGLTGISMTNAAMQTQAVLDRFNIKDVIFSGIAGAAAEDVNIGDVVICEKSTEYFEMHAARELADGGFDEPEDADFNPFSFFFPQQLRVSAVDKEEQEMRWFEADPRLLEYALQITGKDIKDCVGDACLSYKPKLVKGIVADGPIFVDNKDFRQWINTEFGASAIAMETASIAHVCYSNAVPFLGFRSLSDLAGGGEHANEIGTFFQLAANNSAAVLMEFLDIYAAKEQ